MTAPQRTTRRLAPCLCRSCATDEERAEAQQAAAYERAVNQVAFAGYCSDLDSGQPVRLVSYYRQLAEQELSRVMDEVKPY